MAISVCMATFNGHEHVAEQIASILGQLEPTDELLIVDDASTDTTMAAVRSATAGARCAITLLSNDHNVGHVRTFERALGAVSNDIIVLSDQDDVWLPGYIDRLRQVYRDDATGLVVARPIFCDAELKPLDDKNERYRHPRFGGVAGVALFLVNRAMPVGCTMSLRRDELDYLLPFPKNLVAHDHWLFAMTALRRRMAPIDTEAVLYRRHRSVVTSRRPVHLRFGSRLRLLGSLVRRRTATTAP